MPDRKQDRTEATPEFEVAYYTKELGQRLQRKMLEKQLARFSNGPSGSGAGAGQGAQRQDPPDEREPGSP